MSHIKIQPDKIGQIEKELYMKGSVLLQIIGGRLEIVKAETFYVVKNEKKKVINTVPLNMEQVQVVPKESERKLVCLAEFEEFVNKYVTFVHQIKELKGGGTLQYFTQKGTAIAFHYKIFIDKEESGVAGVRSESWTRTKKVLIDRYYIYENPLLKALGIK